MKIKKIHIDGFGKIKDFSLNFNEGMNLIYGDNEAGKSTIQSFIKAMFYHTTGRSQEANAIKKYKPWKGEAFGGKIEYCLDNGLEYKVEKNFNSNTTKVFDYLYNDITNTFETSRETGPKYAEKHFGINGFSFEKTVFVRQTDTQLNSNERKNLFQKIASVYQTSRENISLSEANNVLNEALKVYVGTDRTRTKPMDVVIEKEESFNNKKEELLKKRDSLVGLEKELNEVNDKRKMLENQRLIYSLGQDIINLRETLEKFLIKKTRLERLITNIKEKQEELKSINQQNSKTEDYKNRFENITDDDIHIEYYKMSELEKDIAENQKNIQLKADEINEAEKDLDKFKEFSSIDDEIISKILNDYSNVNKEIEEEVKKNEEDSKSKSKVFQKHLNNYKKAIIGGVITIYAIITGNSLINNYTKALMFIVTIILFLIEVYQIQNKQNITKDERLNNIYNDVYVLVGVSNIDEFIVFKNEYDNDVIEFEKQNNELKEIEKLLNEDRKNAKEYENLIIGKLFNAKIIDDKTKDFHEEDIKEFKNQFNRYKALLSESENIKKRLKNAEASINEYTNERKTILKVDKIDDIDNCEIILTKDIAKIEEELDKNMDKINQLTDDFQVIDTVIEALPSKAKVTINEKIEENDIEYNSTILKQKEVEVLKRELEQVDDDIKIIDNELYVLKKERTRLEGIGFSLKTAINVLNEAGEEVKQEIVPKINKKVIDISFEITDKIFSELRIDDNYDIKIVEKESGYIVSVDELSKGATDQIYLSLRLALGDSMSSKDENLPLIMDEIFAYYDNKRTLETIKFFIKASEEKQVILFTCKEREIEIADEIFGEKINLINI